MEGYYDEMDRPRGKPTGGRSRGRPQDGGQQQSRGPGQQQAWGPPQQQQQPPQSAWGPSLQQQRQPSQAAPPPQQTAWTARGRGVPAAGPPAPQPGPVAQLTQQMTKMAVTRGGGGGSGDAGSSVSGVPRNGSEPTRGTVRQRRIDEVFVFRSADLSSKRGTKGTPVTLQSNVFKLVKTSGLTLLQYRVDFQPDIDDTRRRKGILSRHREHFGAGYIFDGTVLYTMQRLDEGLELTTKDIRDESIIRMLFKLTTDLQMGDHNYTQFLNLILRNCLAKMDYQLVNRDFYDANSKVSLTQFKLEIWPGYFTSIRQFEEDIMMVCDLSFKVMRHESVYEFMMNCRQRARDDWKNVFESAIIGSIVITRYNNRTYRVDDVDWDSCPSTTFDMKGRRISYREYFAEKYQLTVRADDQPILVSKPKEKDVRGGRGDRNICLLPEITCLTGIDEAMRADFKTMSAIAEHTRVAPSTRVQRLEGEFMKHLTSNPKCKEEQAKWHLAFEPKLASLQGRCLVNETIVVGNDVRFPTEGQTGDFTRTLVSKRARLLDTGELETWAVLYPQKLQHRDVVNFIQTLARAAQTLGIRIPEPQFEALQDDRAGTYVNAIERIVQNGNVTLIMTIVPNNRADRYEAIKKKCYVQRNVPNQVVLAKNISKNIMSVATKIAIQMSCKIGGSPWTVLVPFKGNTMIVGFDVCHDTRMKNRSVGALVATLNKNYSRYYSTVSFHESGNELSDYLAAEMMKAVIMNKKINGALPDRIFFYRDGVGEGNLHYVLENEVHKIREQYKAMFNVECPITFIVVSKRINFRFFLNSNNPPPGTVVDNTVTLPTMYDFYLVSQSVKQGTVSPTSYNVIYDAQNIKPDIIQQLSYKLTHMYFNWSGTVRVPAPCQYAHKLAFLVGQHIHTAPTGMHDLLYFL